MQRVNIFILVMLLSSFLGAQSNDLDKQYSPGPNTIFNSDPNLKHNNAHPGTVTVNNMFRFSPTMLFRQKIVLFYERELYKGFTAIVGAGKAFGDDVFQKAYIEAFSGFESNTNSQLPEEILTNSKFYGSSPYLSGGLRAYFTENSFDESYVELAYCYEKMTYKMNSDYIKNINYTSAFSDSYVNFKMHAFSFGYGYSSLFGPRNNFSHEFHLNFGIKFIYFDQISEYTYYSTSSGNNTGYQKTGSMLVTKILPSVSVGYAFGFGF